MDPTSLVTPGAQSLVSAILADAWVQARSAIARVWARRHGGAAVPDDAAVDDAAHELDSARDQALALAGAGDEADRSARMQLFMAGYLAGQLAARPELSPVMQVLPTLLAQAAPATVTSTTTNSTRTSNVHNSFSGQATNALQAGDIHGDIHLGGR